MALPDFLVIGVPKAGTTALHAALARHPSLFMCPVKEPKFFLADGRTPPARAAGPGDAQTARQVRWRREDYEALFAGAPPGTLRGESTPFYLYDPGAHRRIRELVPGARLVAVLRDPVERAHSNWAHLRSAGLEPIGSFLDACAAEDLRVEAGWDAFWHYTRLGRYGEQLARLYGVFPREQVLLLRYRSLVDTPAMALDAICAFLGAAPGIVADVPRENVTVHPSGPLRHAAAARAMRAAAAAGRWLPPGASAALAAPLERLLRKGRRQRQPLTWQERQALLPRFEADIALLERVAEMDFSDWLGPAGRSGGLVGARPAGRRQAREALPRDGRAGG